MHTDLLLRPATLEDADTLAEVYLAARAAAFPAMPRSARTPEEVRAWFGEVVGERPRTTSMPAEREAWLAELPRQRGGPDPWGRPDRGTVLALLVLDPEWLHSLYVRPGHTGVGAGSALLDLAKALRPGGFGLWVFESNVRAQEFYRRHGLTVLRRTDGSGNEEGVPDLEMAWDPVAAASAHAT